MSYQKGMQAEALAKAYLIQQGLTWIQSHYRSRFGEIDLVMKEARACLVFVEVRYRKSLSYGSAHESVTWHKQRKLQLTALQYLSHHPAYQKWPARFDVIGLQGEPVHIDWIQHAFGMS